MKRTYRSIAVLFAFTLPATAQITFRDVTETVGLREPLAGLMGHGAAWGDVNGDGWIDLYLGGFADRPNEAYAPADGPLPSQLFLSRGGKRFEAVEGPTRLFARTSGALFADLDNDGDDDLFVANNCKGKSRREEEPQRSAQLRRSNLFRNDGGKLVDVSAESGACPEGLGTARNVGVLDYDRDGLLDLFVVEDRFTKNPSSRLFRNLGDLRFEDVTAAAGLPEDVFGLGLAVGDLNADGRADLFVPHSNRMFLGTDQPGFREVTATLSEVLGWVPLDNEDWPCGAQFADLNRDGLPDLVLSIHSVRARNRIFLHTGVGEDGVPGFRDVTAATGLPGEIPVRCPHVEVQDFDNDGWPDLYLSAGWLDEAGKITPMVLRHRGLDEEGIPQFEMPADPQGEMVYFPAGPSGDYNRDGRRDLCLVNWFEGNWTRLLRNDSTGGNWLQLRVGAPSFNRMGIGAVVEVFANGNRIGRQEVTAGYGYASGQTAWLQFGLGKLNRVEVRCRLPDGRSWKRAGVRANRRLVLEPPGKPKPGADRRPAVPELDWPPVGRLVAATGPELLQPTETLREGIVIAKTAPTVDFVYYDAQDYAPEPGVWSAWGDGSVRDGIYYSAIGDHSHPAGNAFVYAYDPETRELNRLCDLREPLAQPPGRYVPGKIHSQVEMADDGWLYFSTHRGSTRIAFHETAEFRGDWILRHHPGEDRTEVVAHAPLPMQCLPCGVIDPVRSIFYAGTADGKNEKSPQFLAYDLARRKVLFSHERGPARALIRARSGKVYFHDAKGGAAQLLRFDPENPGLVPIEAEVGLRAASAETRGGKVYTVDRNRLWEFDTRTETARELGPSAVAGRDYITSLDLDPVTGHFLYHVPGSHGGAERDGSPLVQYDLRTGTRKVVAFLHPFLEQKLGYIPMGSYSLAVAEDGGSVFITWNGNRGGDPTGRGKIKFNTCALTVVHIPASERE